MSKLLIDSCTDKELIQNILDDAAYPLTAGALDDLRFEPVEGETYIYKRPPGLSILDKIK